MSAAVSPLIAVQTELAEFVHDPLGFVKVAFPWGEGEMAGEKGPRIFQERFLLEISAHLSNPATRYKPFRKAISSGHGIGKSALLAWISCWALSTFEDTKVVIMAGTGDQLKTKTQPEIAKWFRRSVNAEMFEVNVTSVKVKERGHEQTWRLDFLTWSEENPQASAGAHNAHKRLVIIYDEAVGIHDEIWKTQEGAFTDADTEIIMIAFSQCTRSDGYFYDAVFGNQRHRWRPEVIDSRTVEGVNVEEINESIALYGENHDHVRVRWLGLYPLAGEGKFIDLQMVQAAQKRESGHFADDPLVAGVDLSWGGSDDTVIRFRRGLDARSIPPIKIRGEHTRNPVVVREKLADILDRQFDGQAVAMMFLDNSGVGGNAGIILAGLRQLGFTNVTGVNFGDQALNGKFYALRRDEMWGSMKNALRDGMAIDSDMDLASDLQKPILIPDREQRIKLEPKDAMKRRLSKQGLDSSSPDDADALALTFAQPVKAKSQKPTRQNISPRNRSNSWMGM